VYPDHWFPILSIQDAPTAYQGPLFYVESFPVLTASLLPAGRYTFYFGIDLLMDGVLDANPILYDYVTVDVGVTGF
jgi:hypothetical protein